MSDPGYRTDIDWTVHLVCGYCHAVVKRAEFVEHDIQSHGGLERTRDGHALICQPYGSCVCSIAKYEAAAKKGAPA
jgi:hypothetical protein